MGYYEEVFWLSSGLEQTKTERKSGAYQYYVPTKLNTLELHCGTDTVVDIVRAEKSLLEVSNQREGLQGIDGLSRFLLRAEAVSSSYIEGLHSGTKRLMQAELNEAEPHTFKPDEAATEIVSNIHALQNALSIAEHSKKFSFDDIKRFILCFLPIRQSHVMLTKSEPYKTGLEAILTTS